MLTYRLATWMYILWSRFSHMICIRFPAKFMEMVMEVCNIYWDKLKVTLTDSLIYIYNSTIDNMCWKLGISNVTPIYASSVTESTAKSNRKIALITFNCIQLFFGLDDPVKITLFRLKRCSRFLINLPETNYWKIRKSAEEASGSISVSLAPTGKQNGQCSFVYVNHFQSYI